MTDWAMDLDNIIYSIIRAKTQNTLKSKYPDVKFTSEDLSDTPAKFPTIKIKAVSIVERGQDLINQDINAVDLTIQIDVFAKSSTDANDVMSFILKEFKNLRFNVTSLPIATKEIDVYRSIMRVGRIVGSGDKF